MTPEELQAALDQANTDKANLQKTVDDWAAKLDPITAELNTAKANLDQALADKQSALNELAIAKEQLESASKVTPDETVANLMAEVSELKSKVTNLTIENEKLATEAGQWGINNIEKAQAHFKEKYNPKPGTVKQVMVTQDGNVFYDSDINSGVVHAKEKGLLKFTFSA